VEVGPPAPTAAPTPTEAQEGQEAEEAKPLWARILEWCHAHPQPSGYHEVREVALALLPQLGKRGAWLRVYVEVKRKAKTGAKRHPLFAFEPSSKKHFRLVEAGEVAHKKVPARRH
jgi:hypothetical protein